MLRVALDEHPDAVLHGRLAGDPESIATGDAVEVAWEEGGDGYLLPNWRKAG
jgi:hypothetical protein